jgi:ADP-ribose pyrophosphatase YjhB (NUDIX family)
VEVSAGGVVVRVIEGVPHVLLIRDPYRKWGLPKGHAEEGETPSETGLREVSEETGLSDLRLGEELVTIDWYFRSRGKKIHKFTTFFLMYSERGAPTPERGEGITACDWVPLTEAHSRISYENASEVVQVAQRIIAGEGTSEAAD